MGEVERLQFMVELLESVTQALRDPNDGRHCFAEGLCQGSKALNTQAATTRHFRPTFTLANRAHFSTRRLETSNTRSVAVGDERKERFGSGKSRA
jgi:hypothetical protein